MLPYEKHERDIASWMGGRLSVSSGRSSTDKGDGKSDTHLWDAKYTDKKYYSLTGKTWKKVYDEATREYREPLMFLRLIDYDLVVEMVGIRPVKSGVKSKRISEPIAFTIASDKVEYDLVVTELEDYLEGA